MSGGLQHQILAALREIGARLQSWSPKELESPAA
jgi:hypothetical protein